MTETQPTPDPTPVEDEPTQDPTPEPAPVEPQEGEEDAQEA